MTNNELAKKLRERASTYSWDSTTFYASDAELMRAAAAMIEGIEPPAEPDQDTLDTRAVLAAYWGDNADDINVEHPAVLAAKQALSEIKDRVRRETRDEEAAKLELARMGQEVGTAGMHPSKLWWDVTKISGGSVSAGDGGQLWNASDRGNCDELYGDGG
jgi:hypothetical protein